MAKLRVVLPSTVKEILDSQQAEFDCPACNGRNRVDPQIRQNASTGEVEFVPSVRLCSLCRWDGTMSLDELIAHFATKAYVEKLFRMVRKAIDDGTDDSYETATSLVVILYSARKFAEDNNLGDKRPVTADWFMARLMELFTDLRARQKTSHDMGIKAAEKEALQRLGEHAQRTAEGCDLRRAALNAQKDIEAFFDQPY